MKRSASAVWRGGLKDGKGTVSTESGVLSATPYNFRMRFENEKGTNPEELVAAAHAACFSMALSAELGKAGMTADSIETSATVTLEQVEGGFAVTSSHLKTAVKIPNADKAKFQKAADDAKAGCPISKAAAFNLTQSLRALLASEGVTVHGVVLGPVDTDMNRGLEIPKASPESAAAGIFDGLARGEEEIFPDPASASVAESWRAGAAKALERQFAVFVPESTAR